MDSTEPVTSAHLGERPRPPRPSRARVSGAVDRIDRAVDTWWDKPRGIPVLDRIFYTASEAADFSLIWHVIGLTRAVARNDPRSAVELSAALGVESALVNGAVKSLFRRQRPAHDSPRPHHLRQPRSSSFPSGHASAAMVAAALLSRGSRYPTLWYGLATVVAASRTHVRIHHASDVVAGAALGVVLGAVARRLLPPPAQGPGQLRPGT